MRFVKQNVSLAIHKLHFDKISYQRHGNLLPSTIRCILCGPSNCGKTNVMVNLLINENGLNFTNVYLYTKTADQSKYQFLRHVFDLVPNASLYIYNNNRDVIELKDVKRNSVMIFDDIICENQNDVRNYFSMGRHKNIDCFYLAQTYSKIPKQLIRDNANFFIIFKQDDVNLKHIYDENVNSDMSWCLFKKLCSKIWTNPYSFLTINKDCELDKGRYRKMFDEFIHLN